MAKAREGSVAPTCRSGGYGAVLRTPGLPAVFAAHAVSMIGSVAAEVALSIMIFDRTGSALLSALVLACSFLPYAVGSAALSGVADRYPARRVLVACDLASAACVAAMLVPGCPVPVTLVLLAVLGTVAPLFQGSRAASLAYLLGDDAFAAGRSLIRTISQSALLLGFGFGSVAVALVGPRWMLLADAASFAGSALLIGFGTPPTPAAAPGGRRSSASPAGSRWRLLAEPGLRRLLLLGWLPPAYACVSDGLAVAYVAHTGAPTASVGALFAGWSAGAVAGEALVARLAPARRRSLLVPLALVSQLPMIGFAAIPPVPVATALMVVVGLGLAYHQPLDPLLLDAADPSGRGRLFTLHSGGLMTVQGAAIVAGGALGTVVRPGVVVALAGALGVATVLLLSRRAGLWPSPSGPAAVPAGVTASPHR